jgi:hypothetical protein
MVVLASVLIVVGVVNFVTLLLEAQALGGDGLNGYQRQGHYFVVEHGHETEVTEQAWRHSRWHAISVFVTHPLAMGGMLLLGFRYRSLFRLDS